MEETKKYGVNDDVPVDLNKFIDNLLVSEKVDKKTLSKHNDQIKEYLEKNGIEVNLTNLKPGDEEGKLKRLREIVQQNQTLLTATATPDFTITKKDLDEVCKTTKTALQDLVVVPEDNKKTSSAIEKIRKRGEDIQKLKPTDPIQVDTQKYIQNLVLAADKMEPKVLARETEKLKDWLKQNGVEVNYNDLKPGDEVGKLKKVLQTIKDNPHVADNSDYFVTKKDVEQICKLNNVQIDKVVIMEETKKYGVNDDVPVDLNKFIDNLLVSEKVDKKTLSKHNDQIKEYLEKNGIEVNLTNLKPGDEEGKLKRLREIVQQNQTLLTATATPDFTITKKDLDEVCKTTKTALQDLVVVPEDNKKTSSAIEKIRKRGEDIQKLKPTDPIQVDTQKYIQNLVLAADKMEPKVLARETEKLKDWLKQNGVEVNYNDLKPGDEVGKLKKVLQTIKDNPHVADNSDYFVTKKDVEQICKLNNVQIDKVVIMEETKKYGVNDDVPVDLNKFIDNLLVSEKVDKKTLSKHNDQIKEYLEKNGIEVNLTNLKPGDEEGKLKRLREIVQQNQTLLTATATPDFTITKKDLDEVCKTTKTALQDLVVVPEDNKKTSSAIEKIRKRGEDIQKLKPTDPIQVDTQKYIQNLVLAADKMEPKVLARETEKLKDWLKQNGVEVNYNDLKPGDEVGKLKKVLQTIKDNPHVADNSDYFVTKKDVEQICKLNNVQIDKVVIMEETKKYGVNDDVPVDLNKFIDNLLVSEKVDKKTLSKHNDQIKEYLEKNGIEVNLTNLKPGDEEGKLKRLREIVQQNQTLLTATATPDFTITKKDLDEVCKTTKTALQDLVVVPEDNKKTSSAIEKIRKRGEDIQKLKPTDPIQVDTQKYIQNLVLAADKMEPKVLARESEKLKDWLKQNGVEVNYNDLKPGDEVGKLKKVLQTIKDNPHVADNSDYFVTKKDVEQICKLNNVQIDKVVIMEETKKYGVNDDVPVDLNKFIDNLLVSEKVDKKTLSKHNDQIKEYLEKNGIEVNLTNLKPGDEEGKLKRLREIVQQNQTLLTATATPDFTITKKDLDEVCKTTKTALQDLVVVPEDNKKTSSAIEKIRKRGEDIQKLKPTDPIQVDTQKYIQNLVLAADKMEPKVLARETEKLKDWLKQNGVEVNYNDLKPGDEVGKLKKVLQTIKDNPHVADNSDYFVTKKDVEQICKLNNVQIDKVVIMEETKKYGVNDDVPVDLNKFIDNLLVSEKVDKKTLSKHNDQIKEYLEKNGIEVNLTNLKPGDEEGKLKRLREIVQQNQTLLTATATPDFTITKKDLDEVCKTTKTALQDLVVVPEDNKKTSSAIEKIRKRGEDIQKLKPTDPIQVDTQKYIQNLVLAADKMEPKVLARETEKLKDWLKQNGVEVNYNDLKPGDEVGKLKKVLQTIKDNPHVADNSDYFVTKKDVEQICKLNNVQIDKVVIMEETKKYGVNDDVPVDLNKFIDNLLVSEKVDKKTLSKHNDQIKEYLEKNGIEVNLTNLKPGDEEGKLKRLREIVQQNQTLLTATATPDFTITKKDLDEVCKTTKTALQDLVVVPEDNKKTSSAIEKIRKRGEDIQKLKPTDPIQVDTQKYIQNLVLAADKMEPKVLARETEKLKDWLKQNGVEVNYNDLKPGDEVGKLKKVLQTIKDNPHVADNSDYFVTKKDVEQICKLNNVQIDKVVIMEETKKYGVNDDVPVDLNKFIDNLLVSEKVDKKTLSKHNDQIKEYLEKNGIEVNLTNLKPGDEEGKLKRLREIVQQNQTLLTATATPDFTITKKDLDEVCKTTKTALQDLVVVPEDNKKTSSAIEKIRKRGEDIQKLKPTDPIQVDTQKYIQNLVLAADKMEPKVLARETEKLKDWLKQNGVEVNYNDLKPGDDVGKYHRLVHTIQRHPLLSAYSRLILSLSGQDQLSFLSIYSPSSAINNFEYISPFLSIPSLKALNKLIHNKTTRLPLFQTKSQLDSSVRKALIEEGLDPDSCLSVESEEEIQNTCISPKNTSKMKIVVDLLRANNFSHAPLIRQLETLISEKLMKDKGQDAKRLIEQLQEHQITSIDQLQQVARDLQVNFDDLPPDSITLYHQSAKLVMKNYGPLIALLLEFDADEFNRLEKEKIEDMLNYSMVNQIGLPILNYMCLKLSEHPQYGETLKKIIFETSPHSSSSLVLHRFLQSLHDRNSDLERKIKFILILKNNCQLLRNLIEEQDECISVEELFDYLNAHHPYKVERVIQDFSNTAASSLEDSFT